jgi:hypothetical protein
MTENHELAPHIQEITYHGAENNYTFDDNEVLEIAKKAEREFDLDMSASDCLELILADIIEEADVEEIAHEMDWRIVEWGGIKGSGLWNPEYI